MRNRPPDGGDRAYHRRGAAIRLYLRARELEDYCWGRFELFGRLWRTWKQATEAALAAGGHAAIEWPTSCSY